MATTPTETLRWYTNDLIAAHRHVVEAMRRNQNEDALKIVPGALACVENIVATLDKNLKVLETRVERLGGAGVIGSVKEAVTAVTGFFTGLYGQARPQAASRILRDDLVALNFLMTCTTMLHTTSRALGDANTTDVTHTMMREMPPLIMRLTDLLPAAVLYDLSKDHAGLNPAAFDMTIEEVKDAWRGAAV